MKLNLKSHAKINLALNVTGKNKSLHKIESIISFIDLYDVISKLCEEADNILIDWWGEGWYDEYIKEERETKHATEDSDESE